METEVEMGNVQLKKEKDKQQFLSWANLLLSSLIPLMIGVFTVAVTIQQQQISDRQRQQDQNQADDLQKENVFTGYIDDISKLILNTSQLSNTEQSLLYIRTKTLTALRKLGVPRKTHLILFLYESKLIYNNQSSATQRLVDLSGADLTNLLFDVDSSTTLRYNFSHLYLPNVNLINATFIDCELTHSNFDGSIMNNANFIHTDLRHTTFKKSILHKAKFQSKTILGSVDFTGALLVHADFKDSVVESVNFTNANLDKASLTINQLEPSRTEYHHRFDQAIFPNGTFGPVKEKNLVQNSGAEENCPVTNISSPNINMWTIHTGVLLTASYNNSSDHHINNFGRCYFLAFETARVYQQINVGNYSLLIDQEKAQYNLSAYLGCVKHDGQMHGTVWIDFVTNEELFTGNRDFGLLATKGMRYNTILGIIPYKTRRIEVNIEYTNFVDNEKVKLCIFDNIQLSIKKIP
ncbi:unnamed protein product [Didymodactylos carnosus]|uniref:Pentapeptide repeat-containing protein n=1 Tax=Didymodactylos carnosus TaxID=1234261 RepID=A0A8S2E3U0_9BILA|nr:unnamed protein product [Didymodactylos carnosus]CAF3903587.1 unnamed protein product [Didymodactylos carnosus]